MAFVIKDGASGKTAKVNDQNQLLTRSIVESELEDASEEGQAYSWVSGNLDIDAADTMLLVKNKSDTELHITAITCAAGNVATRYVLHLPTTDVTVAVGAGGAVVVGRNLNTGSANVADASAASDEEGNSQGNVIDDISLLPTTTLVVNVEGVILAKNKSVAVDQVSESTAGSVTIKGHYAVGE